MKQVLCLLLVLSSAMLAAAGATTEQVNAVVFIGDHVDSIYTGSAAAPTNDRPAWGKVTWTTGWHRVYFAQLENGMAFRTNGPATNPVVWDLWLEGWTKTSYRMADWWDVVDPSIHSNRYFSGGEIVWTFVN